MEKITNIKEIYNKKVSKEEVEKHILRAEDDIENGRTKDARQVFKEWKQKFGI